MEFSLTWPDYLILAAFLVISLAIGLYHSLTGGRQRTTAEFIMANRRLKVIPTAISLLVSFQSAITLLGLSAEMYCYGSQFLLLASIAVTVSIFLVERFIIPWLYPLKLVSIYEYLELRYSSKAVRMFGASLGILSGVMFMGVAMYAPSAALESVTGIPLFIGIPIMAAVSVAYTALGGMKAVIWTDVFQFFTMFGGLLAIFIKGVMVVGGFSYIFEVAGQEGRLVMASFSPDPRERHTVWNILTGSVIGWISAYGVSQASVQRISAVKTLSQARIALLINIPPIILVYVLSSAMGLIMLAYFASIRCDPLANSNIKNSNQLLPYFVMQIFSQWPGFAGLFLATLYGGALSTLSSILSGAAANLWEDVLQWKLSHLRESQKALVNRILVVLFGVLSTGTAFLAAAAPGPITQVTSALCSSASGPLMALFVMGGISRLFNWKGAISGGCIGLSMSLWLCIGAFSVTNKHPSLPPVATDGCIANSSSVYEPTENYTLNVVFGSKSRDQPYVGDDDHNSTMHSYSEYKIYHKKEFHGLENFYAISYVWFMTFGLLVTTIFGFAVSLITRDKDQERKIDDGLLLRFRGCGCREEDLDLDSLSEKEVAEKVNLVENGRVSKLDEVKRHLENVGSNSFTRNPDDNLSVDSQA